MGGEIEWRNLVLAGAYLFAPPAFADFTELDQVALAALDDHV
jgi:hypothetical protein